MFKNFKFSESNFFANAVIIIAVVVLSTLVLYSPFLAKVFKDSNNNQIGFERIYQNYDGLYYVVSAMTFYNPKAIESLKLEFDLPNEYYAAHLPLYPFFIFLFSLMFGYLKSMILVNTLFTIALSFAFYYLLSFFKLSKKPLILVIVFLFLPRFLVIRSVGAPETLFLTLIILSIIFFEKKNYFLAAFLGALSVATKTPGILLFGAYGLVFLEKIIREKTFKFSFLWIGLIPVGLLAVFSFYQTQYNDFFAYFHTGGVVPMPYPFSVFSSAAKWVGTIWLEDVVLYFSLVTLARFSWNPNLLPFFSFFTIYFLYLWIKNKRVVFAFIFGSMFAFSIQLHYLALFLIPALFIYFLIKIKTFKNIKTTLTQIFSAIFGFIIFTTPLIAFDLRHDFLNFKGFGKLISGSGESYTGFSYWQKIVDTVVNLMNHALFMPLGNGVIFVIIFSLIILTSFFVYKKTKSDFLLINILCVLIYILSFAFIDSARHLHYFTPIYLSFYFLIATVPKIYKSKYVSYSIFSLFLIVFIILNIQGYSYIFYEKNELNQVEHAQKIADSFQNKITGEPIQIVTIPFTESHGQYRYFLDQKKHDLLSQDSGEQAQELFVMCFEECNPDGDAQWQIASFENKKIADEWDVENVKIYKIVHSK